MLSFSKKKPLPWEILGGHYPCIISDQLSPQGMVIEFSDETIIVHIVFCSGLVFESYDWSGEKCQWPEGDTVIISYVEICYLWSCIVALCVYRLTKSNHLQATHHWCTTVALAPGLSESCLPFWEQTVTITAISLGSWNDCCPCLPLRRAPLLI